MSRQIIAIPMGDPAGIGPEIVVKALTEKRLYDESKPLVVGDCDVLADAMRFSNVNLKLNEVEHPSEGKYEYGTIDVVNLHNCDMKTLKIGQVSAQAGQAAFEFIKKAVELCQSGEADVLATTTINKESLHAAEVPYIGHTEIIAGLTGTYDPLTVFEVHGLRVFFLTRHMSLVKACSMVTKERLCEYIERCTEALHSLGVTEGTMAVAGLNPHNGEHGLFGNEDAAIYEAVDEMQKKGYKVFGPVGADSVFHQALHGKYNSVLSLYHDQGHIATKTLDFERTISLTIGMDFLRTSVDHGTALDIAGKGIASAVSMIEAITLAQKYGGAYREYMKNHKK